MGKSKKKLTTSFGNFSLCPHRSKSSKTWVCGESREHLFTLEIWKNQMLIALDGTSSKSSTFGVKRPKVHHFLYPICTCVWCWVCILGLHVLTYIMYMYIHTRCLMQVMGRCISDSRPDHVRVSSNFLLLYFTMSCLRFRPANPAASTSLRCCKIVKAKERLWLPLYHCDFSEDRGNIGYHGQSIHSPPLIADWRPLLQLHRNSIRLYLYGRRGKIPRERKCLRFTWWYGQKVLKKNRYLIRSPVGNATFTPKWYKPDVTAFHFSVFQFIFFLPFLHTLPENDPITK